MGYLLPTEYVQYGLTAETTDDWVTMASALIEAHCRRPSLMVTQYSERLRHDGGGADGAAELSAAGGRGCGDGAGFGAGAIWTAATGRAGGYVSGAGGVGVRGAGKLERRFCGGC